MHQHTLAAIERLLQQANRPPLWDELIPLAGDGSDRPFFRLVVGACSWLAVFPSPTVPRAEEEAKACWLIGRHLWQRHIPVPEPLAYDPSSGGILFEDLGNRLFYNELREGGEAAALPLYRQALDILVDLQVKGREGFDDRWCWDTPRYDRELMINRESNYFVREFCQTWCGFSLLPSGLASEFAALAERVSRCPADFLLHRDYQSRNLMVVDGRLRVIDFQGARLGPLAYDLASLLNDPYASLSVEAKAALLDHYQGRLSAVLPFDQGRFLEDYPHVALQRNLQVLGAYAFLVRERGKEFFASYITPALHHLVILLSESLASAYPILTGLVSQLAAQERQGKTSSSCLIP